LPTVKYRAYDKNLRPRRVKLEVPGWAGQQQPRADGSHEYPWHCVPFSENARAGLELCYPYEEALHVSVRGGEMIFETASGARHQPGGDGPPLRSFGREYFTYRSSIDLKVEPEFAIKIETHPRFYTDTTGTAPIAVPAVLRAWWPMVSFLVFKAPAEGCTHIFNPGEPFVLVTVVPAEQTLSVMEMPAAEAAERELQGRRIFASRKTLAADTTWKSDTNTVFDGTYRRLFGAARSQEARARAEAEAVTAADYDGGGGGGGAGPPAAAGAVAAPHGGGGGAGGGDGDGGGPPAEAPRNHTAPVEPAQRRGKRGQTPES
jgi:hypothetical protein